jgi:hypothetical protein
VLNSTSINGLAHTLASRLQAAGYSRAKARFPQPAGNYPGTVVQYARGDRSEARGVARMLGIHGVEAMTSAVRPLAATAMVAVVVGQNQTGVGAGQAAAGGEAGATGEASAPGGGEAAGGEAGAGAG